MNINLSESQLEHLTVGGGWEENVDDFFTFLVTVNDMDTQTSLFSDLISSIRTKEDIHKWINFFDGDTDSKSLEETSRIYLKSLVN